MQFASPLPWWLVVLAATGVVALVFVAYRRPLVPLTVWQLTSLAALRALALGSLVTLLARPVLLRPPLDPKDRFVPVLVDVSRSMRVADADEGRTRIEEAVSVLERLLPDLSRRFTPEIYGFGEGLERKDASQIKAAESQSHLLDALESVRDRYRGRSLAGVIVLSDGADTTREPAASSLGPSVPIVTVGIGSETGVSDREVVGLSAADPRLDQTAVDVTVSAVSRGYGRDPFQMRVSADGQLVETRRIEPPADGSPVIETFAVAPNAQSPTVVTAEIVAESGEAVPENNRRSVLVSPVGRKRLVLAVLGAPGYDHAFLSRALARDPGLEVDLVVRKGKDDLGHDTFLVQAGGGRASTLSAGFPATREALFAYDTLVLANLESDFFTRAQLQSMADFIAERGGGLLLLGGQAFSARSLIGTPLEEALPVELGDRRGGSTRSWFQGGRPSRANHVTLTAEGREHPVMRIGSSIAETERLWAAMPPLAASATLGGPRPGATVLAATAQHGGVVVPLVAVQRYGRGRSMVFGGEGSWRWKMMLPSTDRSYEYFWRQSARWLTGAAKDPVTITVPDGVEVGDGVTVDVDARDAAFKPVADAEVTATVTTSGGDSTTRAVQPARETPGRFVVAWRPEAAGLYRIHVDARRGATVLGTSDRWVYVGGSDREMTDPRLNSGVLRRLAEATGGRFTRGDEAWAIAGWLESDSSSSLVPVRQDLWHQPWVYIWLIALMATEWMLRRHWGLR